MPLNFHHVKLQTSVANIKGLPKEQFSEVVISGRSNVGKSSLINCLFNRKDLARTSSSPGKTALINYYNLDDQLFLVDLPGYGFAKVSKEEKKRWAVLIDDYLHNSKNIALIVQLIDIRHKPSEEDQLMVNWIAHTGIPFVIVCTKADKCSSTAADENMKMIRKELLLSDQDILIPFSSKNKTGKEQLLSIISDLADASC